MNGKVHTNLFISSSIAVALTMKSRVIVTG